ncbi:MAG: ABC transporter substrate-binding protein [Ignavibacteria bacterium]|jgi:peptide/nickel transport system substrate-binding protein
MKLINTKLIKLLFTAVIISTSILIISCGKKEKTGDNKILGEQLAPTDTTGAVEGDWLIKREMSDAEKLNPIVTNDATAEDIYTMIFESLTSMNYENYEQIPSIASLPEISPDMLNYTFKLNKNVTFSDGHPLTGEDVIFTMKAVKNPLADDAALRNYYEKVKKVELVNGDPYTVRIVMNQPYWFAIYSNGDFSILPKHILDPDGLTDKYSWDELRDLPTAQKNPNVVKFADFLNSQEVSRESKYVVGTGPYMLEKWVTGQSITLTKNTRYWDKQHTPNYVNKIVFKIIQDNASSIVAAKNKEVDLMAVVVPVDFYKDLSDAQDYDMERITPSEPSYNYLGWNENSPLFRDKKVRMALSYLVDRNIITDKILFGSAVPIQSAIYYKQKKFLNADLPIIPYDPEKAKQLLAEAGWKDSDGDGVLDKVIDGQKVNFKFTFLINTNPVRQQVLLVVIDAMKKAGIQADLQQLEWSVYLDKIKKHQFDATYGGWVLGVVPQDPYQLWHSSQSEGEGSNYISYKNPESDKLIEQFRAELDENKRIEIIKRWQQIIYEDQPYTFLWSPLARYVYNIRFKNTRFYAKRNSPLMNEWWVPIGSQRYKQTMN